jgi:hypothetical protein
MVPRRRALAGDDRVRFVVAITPCLAVTRGARRRITGELDADP